MYNFYCQNHKRDPAITFAGVYITKKSTKCQVRFHLTPRICSYLSCSHQANFHVARLRTTENAGDDEELLQEPWVVVGCWYRAEVRSPSSRIFPSDIRVFGGVLDSSVLEEYLSYLWSSVPQIDTFHMREVEARSRRKTGQDSVTKVATGMTTALGGRGRAPPVLATPAGAVTRHWRPPGGGARS